MMRSRSHTRSHQNPNHRDTRSRSPYYSREKPIAYVNNKQFKDHNPMRNDRDDRRMRNDYRDRRMNISPRRSPVYRHRSRSISPRGHNHFERKRDMDVDLRRLRSPNDRSPSPYGQIYRRSPTPQRLTTEAIPKERSIFCGPEGTVIDLSELKKITVDIRRNLPRGVIPGPHGPLRYVFNPADIIIVRRPGEGSRPISDRDEFKPPRPCNEERYIKLATSHHSDHQLPPTRDSFSPPPRMEAATPAPASFQNNYQLESEGEGDLRHRLMEKKNSEDIKERMNADPNFVPQGRYYFEHDNRERFQRGRGRVFRDNNSHRGNNRGYSNNNNSSNRGNYNNKNDRGGGGHFESFRGSFRGNSYRGRQRSPNWKHDLYGSVDDAKPSSTTPM